MSVGIGGLAQLVERVLCKHEVSGSSPLSSTLGLLTIAVWFVVFCGPAVARAASGPTAITREAIRVEGRERTYYVHVPRSYDGRQPVPLVLVFHGTGGHGRSAATLTRFNELADSAGFIAVYPSALHGLWDDGRNAFPTTEPGDDFAFVAALIDHLENTMAIDPKRVYAAGMSSGGMLAQRLACAMYDKIAAVASVAGPLPENLASCAPRRPVSILEIHGTKDHIVPIGGGRLGWRLGGRVLSVSQTIELWREVDACPATADVVEETGSTYHDGTRIRRETFSPCGGGTEVVLYVVEGGGHLWPGGTQHLPKWVVGPATQHFDASAQIWSFFRRNRLP